MFRADSRPRFVTKYKNVKEEHCEKMAPGEESNLRLSGSPPNEALSYNLVGCLPLGMVEVRELSHISSQHLG